MYLYETHLHTAPLSACARAGVRETLEYYKSAGYTGVFLTDHFIDGNVDRAIRGLPYEERIRHFFAVKDEAKEIGGELGIEVFYAFEMTCGGTDFLVYGIGMDWCLAHPDMDKMKKSELLRMLCEDGALVIHAHPFREAAYIDHIRLFPRLVHGTEVFNACRTDFENEMAAQYCKNYSLIPFAGSDNHVAGGLKRFGGMATEEPVRDVGEFIELVLSKAAKPFIRDENGLRIL